MEMATNETIDVAAIRQGLGFTQVELAQAVGVSQPTVALWESRERNPSGSATILLKRLQEKADKKSRRQS
jgi:DNA-binding transcriptional regulator YiaG